MKKYLDSTEKYFPEEIKFINGNEKYELNYYKEFVILNNDLYNEIKVDRAITHNFQQEPRTANIAIIGNYFIYKIRENIFGYGIFKNYLEMSFYKLIVLIIIITDKNNTNELNILEDKIK